MQKRQTAEQPRARLRAPRAVGALRGALQATDEPARVRRFNTELAQDDKMAALNRLVAGVAHEFHGPVGAIQSTNDTLLRWADRLAPLLEGTDHDELREYLRRTITAVHQGMEVTRQATARITSIVKRMTLYAHPDHERCGFVQLVDHPLTLIILTRTILAALPATD